MHVEVILPRPSYRNPKLQPSTKYTFSAGDSAQNMISYSEAAMPIVVSCPKLLETIRVEPYAGVKARYSGTFVKLVSLNRPFGSIRDHRWLCLSGFCHFIESQNLVTETRNLWEEIDTVINLVNIYFY